MARYVLVRVARGAATLAGISILVFFMTHVMGDPAIMMIPADASNELLHHTRESLGLNEPLAVQFGNFLSNAASGDFGQSMRLKVSSRDLLFRFLPATALLAGAAFVFASVVGVVMGIAASLKPRSWVDNLVSTFSMTGVSMPEFWLALLLIIAFAIPFQFIPTSGFGTWRHLILPAFVLSVRPAGRIAQVTRSSMVDVLQSQYIATAHAKGLTKRVILLRHALKNAGVTIVTMGGIEIADLMSGAIIVETIFSWPGIGRLAGEALFAMDFPVVQTVIFWAALVTVTVNLVVDLVYAWLDPRVRYG